jgi:hypothetical protein
MLYAQMVEALVRVASTSVVEDHLDPMQKLAHFLEVQLLPAIWQRFRLSMGGPAAPAGDCPRERERERERGSTY